MTRSKSTTAAAIMQFVLYVVSVVLIYPGLARGATGEGGGPAGYLVTAIAFAVTILGLVSAYGAWMNMKWGKVLAIVVNVVFALFFLGAVVFATPVLKLVAGIMILINALIIVLLLWRDRRPATA